MEKRHNQLPVECRDEDTLTIDGYGAVFYREGEPGTQFELWDNVFERISPNAFDRALDADAPDDVRSLFNHDANIVLGRTTSGTLTLRVDKTGLRYIVEPPATDLVRDQVLTPIERGDVSGSSFMFRPTRVEWLDVEDDGHRYEVRQINEVELIEVGPVVFPAYASTTTDVREARTEWELWRDSKTESRLSAKRRRQIRIQGKLIELNLA